MKYIHFAFAGLFAFAGCATAVQPPNELIEARSAFTRASSGAASRLALVDLHTARERLDQAENSFSSQPESDQTRHLSYLALRSSQTAEARGDTLAAEQQRVAAEQQRNQLTSQRLEQTQTALQQAQQSQTQTAQELSSERQARIEAERQAQAAMASLRQIASVREEQRGMVITLSGEVLFATGQSSLLPIAQQRLDQVAQALRDQGVRHLRVEGYTDSRGSATSNQELSQSRAMAVRNYLVSRGIQDAMIEAVGMGPERPVADNSTAEGRANNRRVEIVVSPAAPSTTTTTTTSTNIQMNSNAPPVVR